MRLVRETIPLSDKAEIRTNFPDADFYLIRKGSEEVVGRPTREFNKEHIGIKITSDDLLPYYMYAVMQYLHSKGYFMQLSKGMLRLKYITVSDVKEIRLLLT